MHPLQTSRSEVYRLEDIHGAEGQYVKLGLTHDLGETLDIYVTKYEPQPNEKTAHSWKDQHGRARMTEMPAYCISKMVESRKSMLEYIERFRGAFLATVLRTSNE